MSEAAATTLPPPAAAAGPVGKPRGIAFVIIISIITLGIYFLYWLYKTGEETKKYSGDGLGGVLWLVIGLLIGIVMWFVAPSEVGKLYSREGQHQPVSGVTGFWMLLPLIGFIIWVVKVQGALNRFWESKGATA
jgi:peptidoglycan biosynthesis protein MviN/MurJ (putative lipid II flippase)